MSSAATIAEFGTSLALAALGISTGTAAVLVPVATLAATFAAIRHNRDPAGRAIRAAQTALKDAPDFSKTDLNAAAAWLASRPKVNLSPTALAAHKGDLPAYLTQLLDDGTLPQDGATRRIIYLCLTAAHNAIRSDAGFHAPFTQDMLTALANTQGVVVEKLDQVLALVQQLTHSQSEKDALMAALARAEREFQTTQNMLANFLEIILETKVPPDQFAASLMSFAASWKQAGQQINALDRSHNLTPELDALRAQAKAAFLAEDQALTFDILEQIDNAEQADITALDDLAAQVTLQSKHRKQSQRGTRETMLSVAMSRGDVPRTVDLLIKLLDNPVEPFIALRTVWKEWYQSYQTNGVPFDGQVALLLVRAVLLRVNNDKQFGVAQNDLGSLLRILGQSAGDYAILDQAVNAFHEALRVRSEVDTPKSWAATQNNLGNTLQAMGQRAQDNWLLGRAVDAYNAALRVRNKVDTPQEWAMTQNNLGNTLQIMGERAKDIDLLTQALNAHRAVLGVYTEAKDKHHWASAQNNLGRTLRVMGLLANDERLLLQAMDACNASLRFFSQTETPRAKAETIENLARLDLAFFDLTQDPNYLTSAQTHAATARAVYARLDAAWYLQEIDTLLDEIARRSS